MVNPNFKVSELIATGGMASIYKGVQLSLDRPIAVKRLHPHLTNNVDFVARFEKEAKAIARLRHENIVSIIDFGKDEEGYYLVMEYVEGKNLKEILKSEKKVPAEIGLIIAEEVAQGLRFAHSSGFVHRDIKPANIMLSKNGGVKITDFGIGKFTNDVNLTATGSLIGSPAYMSPEHVRGTDLDSRADIFSLGVVLYEVLTGEKPFKGENYQEVITQILTEEPKPILQVAPELSLGLAEIVGKCLEKDKLKRYQNCEDLLLDLKKQFDFYQIELAPKLISEYLARPALVASKLMENKIQRHLDWGLHYYNQGESKREEARKEFLEVLRWDPNNPTARECLNKIEKHSQPDSSSKLWSKLGGNKMARWLLVSIGFFLAIIAGYVAGDYYDKLGRPDSALTAKLPQQASISESKPRYTLPFPEEGDESPAVPSITSEKVRGKTEKGSTLKVHPEGDPWSAKTESPVPIQTSEISTSAAPGVIVIYNQEKEKERARNAGKLNPQQLRSGIQFGQLVVKAQPKATVEINGKTFGTVPPAMTFKAEEGKYRIYLKRAGYKTISKKIWVQKDKTLVIEETLKEEKKDETGKSSGIEP